MAWRPGEIVLEGELDNTKLGWTIGWVTVQGPEKPVTLRLKLAGNCWPDLAGWKFRIVRTDPIPDWAEPIQHMDNINPDQSGHVGDVTADQVLKHFECSPYEFVQRSHEGEAPPTVLRKSLYLEWYSNANGRVVIQSTRLAVERQGERAFELTDEQFAEQAKSNAEEMNFFMHQLGDALESQESPDETPDED
ncbi:MAG: hypothetical protein AAF497_14200 [Planctomycetota bacterium]